MGRITKVSLYISINDLHERTKDFKHNKNIYHGIKWISNTKKV